MITGVGAEVDDIADEAVHGDRPGGHDRVDGFQVDLLGPHGVGPSAPDELVHDIARQHVGRTHEPGHERRRWSLVDLGRRADLLDASLREDGDPVAHGERLVLVVGHVDERDARLLLDRLELQLHLLSQLQVQGTQGFVQQQHPRSIHERPSESDTLSLASRQLPRSTRAVALQAHHPQSFLDAPSSIVPGNFADHQPIAHVVPDVHVREQGVVLEHGVDVPLVRRPPRHVHPVQQHPALGGRLETRDHAQGGRLARAGRAEHREELTGRDVQVDAGDRDHLAVELPDAVQPDRRERLGTPGDDGWLHSDRHGLLVMRGIPGGGWVLALETGWPKGGASVSGVSRPARDATARPGLQSGYVRPPRRRSDTPG